MTVRIEKVNAILEHLCSIISDGNLNRKEIATLLPNLLYSIGSSIEQNHDLQTSEAVLMSYAESPTLGNALMAQALWMRDAWKTEEREDNDK